MHADELKALLEAALPDSYVSIFGEGCDFSVLVVSDAFTNLRPVQRQQLVYQHLNPYIASGALHAVSMDTPTQAEYAQRLDNQE